MRKEDCEVVPPLTEKQKGKIQKALKKLDEQREREKRGIRNLFRVELGTHAGCEGSIEFKQPSVRYGNELTGKTVFEEPTCRCEKCGVMFDPDFPAYRRKIKRAADRRT